MIEHQHMDRNNKMHSSVHPLHIVDEVDFSSCLDSSGQIPDNQYSFPNSNQAYARANRCPCSGRTQSDFILSQNTEARELVVHSPCKVAKSSCFSFVGAFVHLEKRKAVNRNGAPREKTGSSGFLG
jgi:hypothetical protein